MKLGTSGEFQWARSFGGPTLNNGHRIVLDGAGFAYAGGTFRGNTDFGSVGNQMILEDTTPESSNLFLVKVDELTGESIWARQAEGAGNVSATRMMTDNAGDVLLAGLFEDAVTFGSGTPTLVGAGGEDAFLARWDTSGEFEWAVPMALGSSSMTIGTLALDQAQNPLISFGFEGTVDFDPGAGVVNLTSVDQADGAV